MCSETVISIALLAAIAGLATDAVLDYHQVRDQYLSRQAAVWVAESQLQRIRLGAPIDSRPPAELVPDTISLETRVEPGGGQWRGFNRVTVVATATLPTGRKITEQIAGYARAEAKP